MTTQPVMNDTKWRELQRAMYEIEEFCPRWRTRSLENGVVSAWDGEWFYHFAEGGFSDIEWLEIETEDAAEAAVVLAKLKKIHVPGFQREHGFRVYGYVKAGQSVDYL